MTVVTLTHSL